MKRFLLLLPCLLLLSCNFSSEKDKKQDEIGKYLYLGNNGVLHIDSDCSEIWLNESNPTVGMKFIRTSKMLSDENMSYCHDCFDDELYEKVQYIIMDNIDNFGYNPHDEDSLNYREPTGKKPKPYNPDDSNVIF